MMYLPYMYDTYPPYLDQGLIQTVSTVSGPRYSRYGMYCISLYLDRGPIQLIQYAYLTVSTPYRTCRPWTALDEVRVSNGGGARAA